MRNFAWIVCVCLVLLCLTVPSYAERISPVQAAGDWAPGNSWYQQFYDTGEYIDYDTIQLTWVAGSYFEPQTFRVHPAGWTVTYDSPTNTVVDLGTVIPQGQQLPIFTMAFADPAPIYPTKFTWWVIDSRNGAAQGWDGVFNGSWSFTQTTASAPPAVPSPATALGTLVGLGALGVIRRWRKAA